VTTTIDTNVIVALWDKDANLSSIAQSALDAELARGDLAVAAPVYAELMACPGRNESFLDSFFRDTGIIVEWNLDQATWREAGRAFQTYAARRRKRGDTGPRRILADFVIGAYAARNRFRLLTLDDHLYRVAFPGLVLVTI
jgi:predicted nucleic acid-binding protein